MGLQVSIFGSSVTGAAPGWTKETVVSLVGSLKLDLSDSRPAQGARLTVVAVLGSTKVIVPTGTQISVSGLSIVGRRTVKVTPGEGPAVSVAAYSLVGATNITDER
jgi:predicted membrane protein